MIALNPLRVETLDYSFLYLSVLFSSWHYVYKPLIRELACTEPDEIMRAMILGCAPSSMMGVGVQGTVSVSGKPCSRSRAGSEGNRDEPVDGKRSWIDIKDQNKPSTGERHLNSLPSTFRTTCPHL